MCGHLRVCRIKPKSFRILISILLLLAIKPFNNSNLVAAGRLNSDLDMDMNSDSESDSDSASTSLPRGVYHYSDTDRQIETSFKVPDFEALDPIKMASDLMASAMKMDTKRKTLAGLELPFSLTGRPMSIQINGESHNAVSLVDDNTKSQAGKKKNELRRSDMSSESRKAFLRARQICIQQSADSCDEALDTFHRIRFGKSLLAGAEDGSDRDDDDDDHYARIIENRLKTMERTDSEEQLPTTTYNPSRYYSSSGARPSEPSSSSSSPEKSSESTSETDTDSDYGSEMESDDVLPTESHTTTRSFSSSSLSRYNSRHSPNNYHDKAKNFLRLIN